MYRICVLKNHDGSWQRDHSLFHQWVVINDLDGRPHYAHAVVELSDGTVELVEPGFIKFHRSEDWMDYAANPTKEVRDDT